MKMRGNFGIFIRMRTHIHTNTYAYIYFFIIEQKKKNRNNILFLYFFFTCVSLFSYFEWLDSVYCFIHFFCVIIMNLFILYDYIKYIIYALHSLDTEYY